MFGFIIATNMKLFNEIFLFILLFAFSLEFENDQDSDKVFECKPSMTTFEIITGFVFSSPSDMLHNISGLAQFTDCLNYCRDNESCQAINFENGVCTFYKAGASKKPALLSPSQNSMFTIYAQKQCFQGVNNKTCSKSWSFEKVSGYELKGYEKKLITSVKKQECLQHCLTETEFECRSVNYDKDNLSCSLSHLDRHSLQSSMTKKAFLQSSLGNIDYFESNCIEEPKSFCHFSLLKNKALKTVNSIHENITTLEECQSACLSSSYRCFSYDLGNSVSNKVCRTSHLDLSSSSHINEPYLDLSGAVTYQRTACYTVDVICEAKEMIAQIKASKLFDGKIYAKSNPNSCVNDVSNSLEFGIVMPFHDLMCDVKQSDQGKFSNDIIIQHHDMVITTKDIGLSINCNYDLSNKSVTNRQPVSIEDSINFREEESIHSVLVSAPNISMKVTDRNGNEITSAQVGDQLLLRFEILDEHSLYQMFIRELKALDGIDNSDIVLIDANGCPTDINIMGFVTKSKNEKRHALEVAFDAFKFPTSDTVQFRALVTPCLIECEPVFCVSQSNDGKVQEMNSYGRRKRSSNMEKSKSANEEEMLISQSIKITDSFRFNSKQAKSNENDEYYFYKVTDEENKEIKTCFSMTGLIMAWVGFLVFQMILILIWIIFWYRRSKQKLCNQEKQFTYTLNPSIVTNDSLKFEYIPSFLSTFSH